MSNTNLTGTIQMVVQECLKGMKLADMATGTVETASPLSVRSDLSASAIPEQALILTSCVKARTVQVKGGGGGSVTINEALNVGDKVLMLRVANGQRYIVLSKL